MNDPWSSLIQTLAGADGVTPAWWPARRVYRLFDRPDTDPNSDEIRGAGAKRKLSTTPKKPLATAQAKPQAPRLKCPCTNCQMPSRSGLS